MIDSFFRGGAAVALLVSGHSILAKPGEPFVEIAAPVVSEKQAFCFLTTRLGSPERQLEVSLRASLLGPGATIRISGLRVAKLRQVDGSMSIDGAAAQSLRLLEVPGATADGWSDFSIPDRHAFLAANIVDLRGHSPLRLAFGQPQMQQAERALENCRSEQLRRLGVVEQQIAGVARWPSLRAESLRDLEYPPDAVKRNEQGIAGVLFNTDARGVVLDCRVVASAGSASLDQASCALVRHASPLMPALDSAGRPIAAPGFAHINWVIQECKRIKRSRTINKAGPAPCDYEVDSRFLFELDPFNYGPLPVGQLGGPIIP